MHAIEHHTERVNYTIQLIVGYDGTLFRPTGAEALARPACRAIPEHFAALQRHPDPLPFFRHYRRILGHAVRDVPASMVVSYNPTLVELEDSRLHAGSPLIPGRAPSSVMLECPEDIPPAELPRFLTALSSLRKQGYRLALDDLRLDLHGLRTWQLLQPDVVKLDQGLAPLIPHSPRIRQLVGRFMAEARRHRCQVILEGVEDGTQVHAALDLGITTFQGYHFHYPEDSASALERWSEFLPPEDLIHEASCWQVGPQGEAAASKFLLEALDFHTTLRHLGTRAEREATHPPRWRLSQTTCGSPPFLKGGRGGSPLKSSGSKDAEAPRTHTGPNCDSPVGQRPPPNEATAEMGPTAEEVLPTLESAAEDAVISWALGAQSVLNPATTLRKAAVDAPPGPGKLMDARVPSRASSAVVTAGAGAASSSPAVSTLVGKVASGNADRDARQSAMPGPSSTPAWWRRLFGPVLRLLVCGASLLGMAGHTTGALGGFQSSPWNEVAEGPTVAGTIETDPDTRHPQVPPHREILAQVTPSSGTDPGPRLESCRGVVVIYGLESISEASGPIGPRLSRLEAVAEGYLKTLQQQKVPVVGLEGQIRQGLPVSALSGTLLLDLDDRLIALAIARHLLETGACEAQLLVQGAGGTHQVITATRPELLRW